MSKEDRDDILAARASDAMARVASVAKGKDMSEWEDESGSRASRTTPKPWEHNRTGDPRQLLHEAHVYERMAKSHREDAKRERERAIGSDLNADRCAEIAADYRKWAAEQGVTNG